MSAESQNYEASIVAASCSECPDLKFDKNRITNLVFTEKKAIRLNIQLDYHDYCSLEVKAYGIISTRGLKSDANLYGELIFDVNSAYFYNHGGYEFAKQFYEDTYKAAIEIVGGEQYILSAVMHADERNRAMSEALGQDVFHYHLHVVYVPVVEKQILWSKRCKDKSLVGTVKETIMQVSSSKKWLSKPALDEQGLPILQKNGKPVLRKSYSVLQDDFFQAMRNAGYTDVERGERGSSEEHLTVTQFKVEREQERLEQLTAQTQQKEQQAASLEKKIEKISGGRLLKMDVLRGAFWYNIWVGIGFLFSFIVPLSITNFGGSQVYVSCTGTVNTPLLDAIKLVSASLEQSSAKKRTGFSSGVSSSCS